MLTGNPAAVIASIGPLVWTAKLRTEGQRPYKEPKQIENSRNKGEEGIWNMWALWECQIGRTKANCDAVKYGIVPPCLERIAQLCNSFSHSA